MSRFSPIACFASGIKQEQTVNPGNASEGPVLGASVSVNPRIRRRRRGFTLLELLLVMAIIVVMASMVSFAIMRFRENSNRDAAFANIRMLSDACKAYKLDVGFFPNSLNDLIVLPTGMNQNQWRGPYLDARTVPMDPWGQPFVLGANNGERVLISSSGPDRQAGTNDDVSNDR